MNSTLDEIAARAKASDRNPYRPGTATFEMYESFSETKDIRYLCAAIEMLITRVKLAEDAARKYLNTAPVDGWHFEDCSFSDDDESGCSCGTGPAEIELREALAAARKLENEFQEKHK